MSVRKLRQQFSQDGESPPKASNGFRTQTQIPVARFGHGQRSQPTSPTNFATLPFKTSQAQHTQPPPLPLKASNIQPPLPFKSSQVQQFQPPPPYTPPKANNLNCFNGSKTPVSSNSNCFNNSKTPVSSNSNSNSFNSPKTPVSSNSNCFNNSKTPVSNFNSSPKSFNSSLSFTPKPSSPSTSPVNGFPHSPGSPDRWRPKFEEAENKRKILMQQNQRLARENEELQRRSVLAERERETALRDLRDKEGQLNHLRKLSEAVYKEYDQLKNQYELETGTMQKAMLQASEWYKQNRALKRRSTALMQRVMEVAPDRLSADLTDDTDSGVCTDDDFDDLRKSVQDLHREIARLQAELNAIRLQEFEAQETIVDLTSQLEEEKNNKVMLKSELKELRGMKENLGQVSRLVATEVTSLREQYEKEKETSQRMKQEADNAKKERNVLAHQSQLLMFEVAGDDRIMQLVMEVENLQRVLEEERQIHTAQFQALQEKLEEREVDGELELVGERFKLAESELQCALERAQRAETHSNQLASKVKALEEELQKKSHGPPPPPPPPLPPPPPPLPGLGSASTLPSHRPSGDGAEANGTGSAVLEMASLLGIPKKQKSPVPGGAIDDIINQIKGGRFTLKSTEPKPKLSTVEEKPPVVQEMINVLGTLRRKRMSSGGILDDNKMKN